MIVQADFLTKSFGANRTFYCLERKEKGSRKLFVTKEPISLYIEENIEYALLF
jgi:hypothetical protein